MPYKKSNKRNKRKKGVVIWLTGIPCSGKTTLSRLLKRELDKKYDPVYILDGDEVRKFFEYDLGYNRADRIHNVKRIAFGAMLLAKCGINVIVANIAPYYEVRDFIRRHIKNYIQIYLKISIEEAMRRDKKGRYQKCKEGKMKNFIGWDDSYDIPRNPDLIVDTGKKTVSESLREILDYLHKIGI